MDVTIVRQKRRSLAFQLTPAGAVVRIPDHLEPDADEVQRFIARSLDRLPLPKSAALTELDRRQVEALIEKWGTRLRVEIKRIQIRSMRSKWGSISTAGVLTLADDILQLPASLAEYIVVHELMHLRFPDHGRRWRAHMGAHLPDWRERDVQLRWYRRT